MTLAPLVRLRKISKAFPGVQALKQVDFDLRTGEVHALVGMNGAGKSTLVKILAGLYTPDSGQIYWRGQPVCIRNPRQARELGIAYIPQELMLVPKMSVAHNLLLNQEPKLKWLPFILDERALRRKAQIILANLGVNCPLDIPVNCLSVATQQMIAIAIALHQQSQVLIMDEPTASLARSDILKLFRIIHQLKDSGQAVIYISHRLEEIFQVADRVTVLRDGVVQGTFATDEIDTSYILRLMVGHRLASSAPYSTISTSSVEALAVKGLTRRGMYEDIEFKVHHGEILGIFGHVGAGKTELLRGIFGADPIDAGEIRVGGVPVRIDSPVTAIRLGMGFLTEDRKGQGLILSMGIADNIALANLDTLSKWGLVDFRRRNALAWNFIRKLNITPPSLNRWVKFLSGGNQQKVILARWLSRSCQILLLDEPTKGIDVRTKAELYELMIDLARGGAALIVASSDLSELMRICNRILVMKEGRLTAHFLRDEATEEEILSYAI
ncbi:MAG: D-xylose ABC transporter ATP-binding protein [Thermoplasmata archaeon]|nr:MAG: D-xylose ABC transporter ATP-binding protein [Thermoplasmata archaeon]